MKTHVLFTFYDGLDCSMGIIAVNRNPKHRPFMLLHTSRVKTMDQAKAWMAKLEKLNPTWEQLMKSDQWEDAIAQRDESMDGEGYDSSTGVGLE